MATPTSEQRGAIGTGTLWCRQDDLSSLKCWVIGFLLPKPRADRVVLLTAALTGVVTEAFSPEEALEEWVEQNPGATHPPLSTRPPWVLPSYVYTVRVTESFIVSASSGGRCRKKLPRLNITGELSSDSPQALFSE